MGSNRRFVDWMLITIDYLGAVFTAASLVHGGKGRTTTISVMVPVLHHGMIIVCVPDAVRALTQSGRSYGHRRSVGPMSNKEISELDAKLARPLGKRTSELTQQPS